jgi:type IX secretion system substrate protein/galactose oxidase-like protein
MKKIITVFIFCFLCGECFSQAGEWVWIKGDSTFNQPAHYGLQGIPSPTNNPPSLYEPCEWTDLNGNFWLFGGLNFLGNQLGDLWKYDSFTNEWTWIKGSGLPDDTGSYGVQGVPSQTNYPLARAWGVMTWVDNQNNLWMYGGYGNMGGLNDLWKYNISTNEWTWINGSNLPNQPAVYGAQGIPSPNNSPGNRNESAATWTDNAGDLWLFGGEPFVAPIACFNDLWRYNIASNEWTWMKGDSTPNSAGVYGTLGMENAPNTPGGRQVYTHWKDNVGNFWLFGGIQWFNGISNSIFNDLWRYNFQTNNWTWMSGSNTGNAPGNYGTICVSASTNVPGARFENRASWLDQFGNFWTFGGGGDGNFNITWNDLWMYCFASHQWIWKSGDNMTNPTGHWGTIGVSNPANKPNGRGGEVTWTSNNGHLYLFGGSTSPFNHSYSDLWKYTIDTTCGVCPAPNSIKENNFTNELLVFPNPANSSLTISFPSSEKQKIELRIYNTLGKQIYVEKEEITKGKFEKEINVKKLSGGIYFLQLKTKDGVMSRKVMVQH